MSKKVVRILSIDGGGIRGIIPAKILDEIEKRTDKRISQLFDMIVGTSTGGILALALTMPNRGQDHDNLPQNTAEELVGFYRTKGKEIFHCSWIEEMANLVKAKYSPQNMQRILAEHFQQTSLGDALCDVIIPSYEMGIAYPWFFKSARAKCNPDYDFLMKDVALATSAAPTFFPPHHIPITVKDEETGKDKEIIGQFIDGGVYANHPAMCALAEIKKKCPQAQVLLVSLGTGERALRYRENRKRWGIFFWRKRIFDVIFDGASDTVSHQSEQFRPLFKAATSEEKVYYRFQFQLSEKNKDMDDASDENLNDLESLANILISKDGDLQKLTADGRDDFNRLCQLLRAPTGTEGLPRQETL